MINQPKLVSELSSSTHDNEPPIDVKKLNKRLKELDKQMENLIDLYQLGNIPMELLSDRIKNIDTEKSAIQRTIDSAQKTVANPTETFKDSLAAFSESFDTSPLETKRLLVSSLIKAIRIDGRNVSIEWRV